MKAHHLGVLAEIAATFLAERARAVYAKALRPSHPDHSSVLTTLALGQEELGDSFEHLQTSDLVLMSSADGGDEKIGRQPSAKEKEPTQEDVALQALSFETKIQINTDGRVDRTQVSFLLGAGVFAVRGLAARGAARLSEQRSVHARRREPTDSR